MWVFSPRASRSISVKVVVVVVVVLVVVVVVLVVLVTHYKFVRICTTKYRRRILKCL